MSVRAEKEKLMFNTHSCPTDRSLHRHWIVDTLENVGVALCIVAAACVGYIPVACAGDNAVRETILGTSNYRGKHVKFMDIKDVHDVSKATWRRIFKDLNDKWSVGRTDINGDGEDDFFLWTYDRCGSIGCSCYIMASRGKTDWREVAVLPIQGSDFHISDTPITVLRTKYLGYNDLALGTSCHLPCSSWNGILRFDGKRYERFLSYVSEYWNKGSFLTVARVRDPRTRRERILDMR